MDEKAPKIIGKYKILEELGKGAFGVSYLAEHELLGKKVVIKLARTDMPDAIKRLKIEAKASSKLSHPNIAQIYDVGTTDDGQFYLATEWAGKESLGSVIKEDGPLKPVKICSIIESLAKALSYAHSKGFIHRDIKPSNILIAPEGTAKLIDFGLAGVLQNDTKHTIAGEIFGTPVYMSPEQIRGESQSAASDIYSIGIVIYEMAYGRTPFQSKNLAGLFREIIQGSISFPSDPNVPTNLKTLIKRCTDPDPRKRITSGEELLKAIGNLFIPNAQQVLASSPVADQPEPVLPVLSQKASPKLFIVSAILIIIAFFILSWIFLLSRASQSGPGLGSQPKEMAMLIGSIILISVSIFAGIKLGKYLNRARPEAQRRAETILIGTADRDSLTKSIAIEIDGLFDRLKTFDERFLAQSIALVLKDYEGAKEIDDRQKALMNAVTILEKLTERLSPWYVRHEKAVAFTVSSVGVISGLATAAATIMKMVSK